jgi:DNA-binding NtrC family response regulator
MNILVIENEIYLAQKIVSKLINDGYNCDHIDSPNTDAFTKEYNVILLSTSFPFNFCYNIIKKYNENCIIILLVSYISDETVTLHIKSGAKDYIMKPFIMNELIRKIYHHKECRDINKELLKLRNYFQFTMLDIKTTDVLSATSFPILIETNVQKYADKLVYELSIKMALPITFISLSAPDWQKRINEIQKELIIYLTNYQTLKKHSKDFLLKIIENKNCVISTLEEELDFPYTKVEARDEKGLLANSNIMTIPDYVKAMVTSYQHKYTDTELSKKLGISRKSLWERRKKFDIEKRILIS